MREVNSWFLVIMGIVVALMGVEVAWIAVVTGVFWFNAGFNVADILMGVFSVVCIVLILSCGIGLLCEGVKKNEDAPE